MQIENDLGLPEFKSAAEAEFHAAAIVRLFQSSLPLSKGIDEKDRGPADDVIPLAVASLLAARQFPRQDDPQGLRSLLLVSDKDLWHIYSIFLEYVDTLVSQWLSP